MKQFLHRVIDMVGFSTCTFCEEPACKISPDARGLMCSSQACAQEAVANVGMANQVPEGSIFFPKAVFMSLLAVFG